MNETMACVWSVGIFYSLEVEKVFEAKMKPETLRKKAGRMQGGTNVPPCITPQSDNETPNNQDEKPTHSVRRIDGSV